MTLDESHLGLAVAVGGLGVSFFIGLYLGYVKELPSPLPPGGWQLYAGVEDREPRTRRTRRRPAYSRRNLTADLGKASAF